MSRAQQSSSLPPNDHVVEDTSHAVSISTVPNHAGSVLPQQTDENVGPVAPLEGIRT